ncbi:protein-tyrosine-phosphatase [Autumnicola musiva]|uniref:Protein-tyrosine-phosphatase n=1 Tax=Autumnicola musiva TaxID=3075589 RepID=A0ABU3D1X7_9FLAO|nr:protein-tyrosine-phosphatase [Zunongwangia sp. F117]MDT0675018.1 protein-tyrosine-phosphatase [Zunongwangia sp. F117]
MNYSHHLVNPAAAAVNAIDMEARNKILPKLQQKIEAFEVSSVSEERKKILAPLIEYIAEKATKKEVANINFICTHNSRRSQFAQIWAQGIGQFYDIPVQAFSGGVEVTAFNENAVKAIKSAGFKIVAEGEENPLYSVFYAEELTPVKMFSKKYDDKVNPQKNFAAVMTCSHADETCPFIPGAEKRIAVKYEDPKEFDNTPEQDQKYRERSEQIAAEMKYVFSSISVKY